MRDLPRVLFVCGRNAIRSPMAAALWNKQFGDQADARSCGVIPAAFVDPFTVVIMQEVGYDLEDLSPTALAGIGDPPAELVVSLSVAANRMASEYAAEVNAEFLAWQTPDPSETGGNRDMKLLAYRETREAIATCISEWQKARQQA